MAHPRPKATVAMEEKECPRIFGTQRFGSVAVAEVVALRAKEPVEAGLVVRRPAGSVVLVQVAQGLAVALQKA